MENFVLRENSYKVDKEIGNIEGKRMRPSLVRQEGRRGWRKTCTGALMV